MRVPDAGSRAPGRERRLLAGSLTFAIHLIVLAALLWPRALPSPTHRKSPPLPLEVSLVDLPKPKLPAPPAPSMIEPARPRALRPPHLTVLVSVPDTSDILSETRLRGATVAGGGSGGCDMAGIVQRALRGDPMVSAAVEAAHRRGKTVMLWDGDWVRSGDQDGKGLSAVREAILWQVGFAPLACRDMRMHGLVLLSLAHGDTRFALGTNDWRWSDLLGVRRLARER
ncbi:MAG: hypothetical protein ACREFW_05205 [Rhizomicrobium sp.]